MSKHLAINMVPHLLLVGITLILSLVLSSVDAQDEPEIAVNNADSRDMLAYVSEAGHLMLYDPRNRTETTLLNNVADFVRGQDGRVAFTKLDENDPDLYVFDPSTPALAPINISQNPAANNYPLAWSPDGRYLAFVSFRASSDDLNHIWTYQGRYLASSRDQSLYVWDGEQVTNIMPDNQLDTANAFYSDWSYDGRLAFTIQHSWPNLDIHSEIYIWDGSTTLNLTQNPEREDGRSSWSRNGQLMFGSQRGEEGGIYVWDGVSFKDGSPDVESFIRLAPELKPTSAMWMDDGLVGFTVYPDPSTSGTKEIILWDLEKQAIAKQFPVASENAWSSLAEGGQVILSSHLASGIPSVYLDVENTEGEILFSDHVGEFAWSSDGYLAYCGIEEGMSRVLSIWDGEESWVVARVSYKPVQWQHGRDTFSCNNG